MKLSFNAIFNLLNLVLPVTIDGRKLVLRNGVIADGGSQPASYRFAAELKHRDLRNRRKLREAMQAFQVMREDAAERLIGERMADLPLEHPKHTEFMAEVDEIAKQTVEVDLRPYKLEHFALDLNDHYPSSNLDWLDREGLLEFADDDEKPDVPPAVQAAA